MSLICKYKYEVVFTQAVVKTLGIHGIKSNLEKFEIPRMMSLAPEVKDVKLCQTLLYYPLKKFLHSSIIFSKIFYFATQKLAGLDP